MTDPDEVPPVQPAAPTPDGDRQPAAPTPAGDGQPAAPTPDGDRQPARSPDSDIQAAGGADMPVSEAEAPSGGSGFRVGRSAIVAVVVVGALLVGGYLFRDRLSGGAGDIQVGDCFLLPASTQGQSEEQVVDEVEHRPCTEAHDAEAFFVGNLDAAADATFPDASTVEDFVTAQCVPAFQAYTGSDFYTQQPLDAGYFSPTADSWRLADREVMCYLTPIDGATTTQSYKGANP